MKPASSFAKLDMYLSDAALPLFKALEDWMKEEAGDIDDIMTRQNGFSFGQICGIDFARADPGRYSYLATLSLAERGVPPGFYHSVLITPFEERLEKPEDFEPERHLVAINELSSFSGSVVFASHMLGRGDERFPRYVLSGGHLNSVEMISEGKAMLAAIDRLSLNLANLQSPRNMERIRVLGKTPDYPGLPFVAPGHLSSDAVGRLTRRLLDFAATEMFLEYAPPLGINGIVRLPPGQYDVMKKI